MFFVSFSQFWVPREWSQRNKYWKSQSLPGWSRPQTSQQIQQFSWACLRMTEVLSMNHSREVVHETPPFRQHQPPLPARSPRRALCAGLLLWAVTPGARMPSILSQCPPVITLNSLQKWLCVHVCVFWWLQTYFSFLIFMHNIPYSQMTFSLHFWTFWNITGYTPNTCEEATAVWKTDLKLNTISYLPHNSYFP